MDGKRIVVVAVVALLIGLLATYLFWGSRQRELAGDLAAAKSRLAAAGPTTTQADATAARLTDVEARLKQATEQLDQERARRQALEVELSRGRK